MAAENGQTPTSLSKDEQKRIRREEHERNVAAAVRRKEEKKANARRQQTEARRALSEKDSRLVSIKIDIDAWKQTIADECAQRYGGVEKCTYNPMTQSFDVVFEHEEAAHSAIRAPGPRLPNMPPHLVERKMNRGRCIYFGEPRLLDHETVKSMSDHDYDVFKNKVRQCMERFGKLSKYEVLRNAQVVEFESFENAQQVLEVARTSPGELEIDGVSLLPVFSGLPKRNFEATKRKLQAAHQNQEEEKSKRQRLEAEQAAGKAAAAAASGGLLPDQAHHFHAAATPGVWGPPPPGHLHHMWGPPPPHAAYGPYGPPPHVVAQQQQGQAGAGAGGGGRKKRKGKQQQQQQQQAQSPYGPAAYQQAYYMGGYE